MSGFQPCKEWPDGSGGFWGRETGVNLGAGYGVFRQKVDNILQFKSLNTGMHITLSATGEEIIIEGEPGILNDTVFPSTPKIGQHFFRRDLNQTWLWDGNNWVFVGPTYSTNASPANPANGQFWHDLANNVLYYYNGTSWEKVHTATNTNLIEMVDVQSDYGTNEQFLMSNGTDAVWDNITVDKLFDVDLSGLDNHDHLRWNSTTMRWETRSSSFVELIDTAPIMGGIGQILVSNGASLEWQGQISPSNNDMLIYNDVQEEWQIINSSDVGPQLLNDLTDVNIPVPNENDFIVYNGSEYVSRKNRLILTSDITFYVNASTGNDLNNGLTAGTAFQNIQTVLDYVRDDWDLGGYTVTITVADGTYTENLSMWPVVGYGSVEIIGNQATPASVQLNGSITVEGASSGDYILRGLRVDNLTGNGLRVAQHGKLSISDVHFGTVLGSHIEMINNSVLFIIGNYGIIGNGEFHFEIDANCAVEASGITVDILNNLTFTGVFAICRNGIIRMTNITYNLVGTVTGQRYSVVQNGVIATTPNGDPNYFPGTIAGTTATGGIYD